MDGRSAPHNWWAKVVGPRASVESEPPAGKHTRSWDLTIAEGQARIAQILRRNPSLESQLDALLIDAYELARIRAAGETDLDLAVFPKDCPFSIKEVRGNQESV